MVNFSRLLIVTLCLWPYATMAGWIVGNGGDGLRLQFKKAKEHAAHLTIRVSERALNSVTSPEVTQWILQHQGQLAADILSSPHEWTLDEKPTCAWTTPNSAATIDFSFPTCLQNTASFHAAGEVLIHESVHHLGVESEDFADSVAVAIYSAYKAGKVDWLQTTSTSGPEPTASHSMVWTGSKVILQGGLVDPSNRTTTNATYSYDIEENSWERLSSTGAPSRYDHIALIHNSKMIVWGGLTAQTTGNVSETWHNSGAIYDITTNEWSAISNPYGPSTMDVRIAGKAQSAVIVNEELIVWGGVSGSRAGAPGAALNLTNNTWRKIADGGPIRKQDHIAVAAAGKMIVWGGIDANNRATSSGAIYNPSSDSWSSMSNAYAPEGLDAPVAVWTGKRLIVFGGYYSSREIRGLGGQYDLSTNQWSSFVSEIAIGRTQHSAVWTGQEMVVFGGWNSRLRAEFGTPVAFDPESGSWRALSSVNGPRERSRHGAIWTGSKMMIWGGVALGQNPLDSGALFYP